MTIIFTAKGEAKTSAIDPRFGRCAYLLVYREEEDRWECIDNREIDNVAHGAGPKTAAKALEVQGDVLITGNGPGKNAEMALSQGKLRLITGAGDMTVEQAYQAFKEGKLT